MSASAVSHDYDVLVIGSGFEGSVTALRLTEKGYRVFCTVRAGRSALLPPDLQVIP